MNALSVYSICFVIDSLRENSRQRRKPRTFRWPRTVRTIVAANINTEGRQLRELITKLAEISGNPRDACLRFARQLGVKAKQPYRKWTKEEQKRRQDFAATKSPTVESTMGHKTSAAPAVTIRATAQMRSRLTHALRKRLNPNHS